VEIRIVGSPLSDVARSDRRSQSALGFAPIGHVRTLKQWARDPLGRQRSKGEDALQARYR